MTVAPDPAMPPKLTAEQIQRAIEACRTHLSEMSDTFRGNLDCGIRLSAAEPRPFSAQLIAPEFGVPGLAVTLSIGQQGLLLLVPDSIPLPAWHREPGISENNRLQTFAHELSLQVLPADLQADRYAAVASANLQELVERSQVSSAATMLELPVHLADAGEGEALLAKILVILPVDAPPLLPLSDTEVPQADTTSEAESGSPETAFESLDAESSQPDFAPTTSEKLHGARSSNSPTVALDEILRALRVLQVPVTVSVRLAERKMPVGQVVAMAPGSLITFSKSCEDLLDLFVNNHRYCQGEAIKIGENFGLKITRLGAPEERKEHAN